ncbi:MAG TPA: dienelactone hydrolase family protein [Anaeromyxobacteraceae bacterium]|nr:dienelactone hydrolase family protein [Anaeromyxobacteraceae bacterium]
MHALRFAVAAALGLLVTTARAEIVTRTVEYRQGDTVLEGFLAYQPGGPARKPGVLVVHDWLGVSADTRKRAEQLAAMGYVAFAADIYGKGVRPASGKEAAPLAGKYKADRKLLRARVMAGFDELARQPNVDPDRIAAIGYCFGGTTVLELARAGAKVAGVVSFHGGLDSPTPADGKNIKGKVLALHGADDPFVPEADLKAFEQELRSNGVDWQLVKYGGAVHSFTIVGAGNDNSKGAAYNAAADRRSWKAMEDFFAEIFAKS